MSATVTRYKILVGGEFAAAASGETMEVIAPATGETIAEVPRCGADGCRQSAYGKDMSIYSMEEYTQLKHVAIKID